MLQKQKPSEAAKANSCFQGKGEKNCQFGRSKFDLQYSISFV